MLYEVITGASAIQVGTANFIDPTVTIKIIEGLEKYCADNGFTKVSDLTGAMICD